MLAATYVKFALPHCINALYGANPRWLIETLFVCTAQTVAAFASNPQMDGRHRRHLALSLVLHSWTQDLQRHIDLYAVMVCGVFDIRGVLGQAHAKPQLPVFGAGVAQGVSGQVHGRGDTGTRERSK